MEKANIIVSGKNGQLGFEFSRLVQGESDYNFLFFSREELDISSQPALEQVFHQYRPAAFINCGAYTQVDKAETDRETAFKINAEAVGLIANLCRIHDTVFIHFSTDYVFDGMGVRPYKTSDKTAPVNYYGYTKWMGEELALKNNDRTIIIRTSWVYSTHGKNFVKTMLKLMSERPEISVVNDQIGAPTYAADLAEAVLQMLPTVLRPEFQRYGVFHFSNEGVISWFQFAEKIKAVAGKSSTIHPIDTAGFPTPAKRPAYSVFDLSDIEKVFGIQPKPWDESLIRCLQKLKNDSAN